MALTAAANGTAAAKGTAAALLQTHVSFAIATEAVPYSSITSVVAIAAIIATTTKYN